MQQEEALRKDEKQRKELREKERKEKEVENIARQKKQVRVNVGCVVIMCEYTNVGCVVIMRERTFIRKASNMTVLLKGRPNTEAQSRTRRERTSGIFEVKGEVHC